MRLHISVACALLGFGYGCGGGNGGGGAGTGGGGPGGSGGSGGSSATLYRPCTDATHLGGFAVELLEDIPNTSIAGGVREGVLPASVWQQVATGGDCRLIVGPTLTCTPACANPQICAGQNQCIAEPRFRSAGTATITGVGASPIVVSANAVNSSYYASVDTPYPPAADGANITLQVAGADIPALSLSGRGIPELQFPGTALTVTRGQAFAFTWTPPAQPGAARISASLDIAHHGGVAARIECDFDDDGSGEMPTALVDQLIDRGTAGFPELTLTRRTVDSTMIPAGCVDFQVASVIPRQVTVCSGAGGCVISCTDPAQCPTGQVCRTDRSCGAP